VKFYLFYLQSHIILLWNLDSLFPFCKNVFVLFSFSTDPALPCLSYLKYKLNNQGIYTAIIITNRYTKRNEKRIKFITFASEIKPKEWFELED